MSMPTGEPVHGQAHPRQPTFVAQNMEGAAAVGPPTGYTIWRPRTGACWAPWRSPRPLDHALKQNGVQFDAGRFNWIGNPIVDNQVFNCLANFGLPRSKRPRPKAA